MIREDNSKKEEPTPDEKVASLKKAIEELGFKVEETEEGIEITE